MEAWVSVKRSFHKEFWLVAKLQEAGWQDSRAAGARSCAGSSTGEERQTLVPEGSKLNSREKSLQVKLTAKPSLSQGGLENNLAASEEKMGV